MHQRNTARPNTHVGEVAACARRFHGLKNVSRPTVFRCMQSSGTHFFPTPQLLLLGQDLFVIEASRLSRRQSVGLLRTSDQPVYLTIQNRQTSMPTAGFEPTIPASELPQTQVSDRAATGTGCCRQSPILKIGRMNIWLFNDALTTEYVTEGPTVWCGDDL